MWDYLVKHDLVFKVKLCIPAHDEWNIEVPEELADEMTKVLQDCMAKAGGYFCRKLKLLRKQPRLRHLRRQLRKQPKKRHPQQLRRASNLTDKGVL